MVPCELQFNGTALWGTPKSRLLATENTMKLNYSSDLLLGRFDTGTRSI